MNTPTTIHIKAAGYENIYFDCQLCGHENVLNRATELGAMPISGREVTCQNCLERVWLNSDMVQMATYHWFLQELPILKQRKLYRNYAITLCQCAENFFLQAIINKRFDREPTYRDEDGWFRSLDLYNNDLNQFKESIKKYTFDRMRSEFLKTFANLQNGASPQTLGLKEDKRNWALATIKQSKVNELRNKVAHKDAYRPTLQEIEAHKPLDDAIFWLGEYLRVYASTYILNNRLTTLNASTA